MVVSISLTCGVSEAQGPSGEYNCWCELTDCVKRCSDQDLSKNICKGISSKFCGTMNSTATPSTYQGCNEKWEECMNKSDGLNDDTQTKGWPTWEVVFAMFITFAIGGGMGAHVVGNDHWDF